MKRSMLLVALLAVTGTSWGQGRLPAALGPNLGGALDALVFGSAQFPGGLAAAGGAFSAGEVTLGFRDNTNGFEGFTVALTQNTPFASFGVQAAQSYNSIYTALVPFYQAFDGPAMQLAALGSPLTQPLSMIITSFAEVGFPPLPGLD